MLSSIQCRVYANCQLLGKFEHDQKPIFQIVARSSEGRPLCLIFMVFWGELDLASNAANPADSADADADDADS